MPSESGPRRHFNFKMTELWDLTLSVGSQCYSLLKKKGTSMYTAIDNNRAGIDSFGLCLLYFPNKHVFCAGQKNLNVAQGQ